MGNNSSQSVARYLNDSRRVARSSQWEGLFWGSGGRALSAWKFCIFFKNNLIFGLFSYKVMLLKRGIESGSANLIKLLAQMDFVRWLMVKF